MNACPMRGHVDRHFAGTISPPDERSLRAHLLECDPCREHYARHHLLSRLDPTAMRPEDRIGQALGMRDRAHIWPYAASLVAMAACVLLFLRPPSATDGFASRGGAAPGAASHVLVYHAGGGGTPALAGSSIGAHDELAFAYENGAGKPRLMVFGTDEHAHVYWFYPAWTRPEDNPVAIPVATDGVRHELTEAITHHFDGRQLVVHALFLDDAMPVEDVETMLRAHPSGPLPIAGAIESTTSFTLDP
jgi:Putative zinc-finger